MFDGGKAECRGNDDGRDGDGGGDRGDRGGGGGGGGPRTNPDRDPGSWCEIPEGQEATICEHGDPESEPDGGGSIAPPIPSESDFATFDIPPSTPHALPVDWTVIGKPTAFWADASVKEFSAELLGFPLQVRATPIEFHWDFGDGNSTSAESPGREPSHPQYGSITHTFSDKGDRTVTLTTVYTGEYNYGGGWSSIAGTAAVQSDGLSMTVYRYHKYRVEDDCNENPYGTDCAAG
ncbi:PKD domain-containing protein [Brevibacterium jeotgali]|uniref:PKD domain-containing protein n=1 Tax=Brevibacterium jeotgali TaxID=1262550 RepID=UPI000C787054|nr:PKD domain-containing protein [Brevibacterium jeotgali]